MHGFILRNKYLIRITDHTNYFSLLFVALQRFSKSFLRSLKHRIINADCTVRCERIYHSLSLEHRRYLCTFFRFLYAHSSRISKPCFRLNRPCIYMKTILRILAVARRSTPQSVDFKKYNYFVITPIRIFIFRWLHFSALEEHLYRIYLCRRDAMKRLWKCSFQKRDPLLSCSYVHYTTNRLGWQHYKPHTVIQLNYVVQIPTYDSAICFPIVGWTSNTHRPGSHRCKPGV